MKIHEQPDWISSEFEVREKLRLMDGKDLLYRFQLENNSILDQEIDAKSPFQLYGFV